jgi:hypothetical protein
MRFKEEHEGPIDPYPMTIERTPREVTEVRRISAVAVFLYAWNNELHTFDVELGGLVVALEDKEIDSNLEVISEQIMDAYRLLSAKKLVSRHPFSCSD